MHELRPFSPLDFDLTLRVDVRREGDLLRVGYELSGEIEKIRLPDLVASALRRDELWKTTCFELFAATRSAEPYWEFNFSPSGDWNCYSFNGYRSGMTPEKRVSAPAIRATRGEKDFRFEVSIDRSKLPAFSELSAAAVIESFSGGISYWAVRHAGAQPDFHRRESFIVQI